MLSYRHIREHYFNQDRKTPRAQGPKLLVLGFLLIILLGTILLALPIASQGAEALSWQDAFFTSVSATTVTGLVVIDTESSFSTFGELVILFLIQVGGVGFITLSVILFRVIGRRVSLFERNLLRQTLGLEAGEGVVKLTLAVLLITIIIELVGAFFLFTQWIQIMDWRTAAYYAIFHSISAFCNAGFDLFHGLDDPILHFTRSNPVIIIVLCILITIGTLGITVIDDLLEWPKDRQLSLHTRLVLPFTLILIVIGTALVMIDEAFVEGHALSYLPQGERGMVALFTVVSSRTAGITLIPMNELGDASQVVILMWMFIGGAPASMGGGVGLSTVAVVFIALLSTVRGYSDVRTFERTLPTETIIKAVAVLTVSTILIATITIILLLLDQGDLYPVAFEVVSAFSNTGYSLGITREFNWAGRFLLAFTMFWGRLGPLTLIVLLAQRHRQTLIKYPAEKIIIG